MQSSNARESVLKQAQALQDTIDRLTEQRILLLQGANIYPPPTAADFPNEILSHVFQYACSDPLPYTDTPFIVKDIRGIEIKPHDVARIRKPSSFPIVLGNVCSSWRAVVKSKPECWITLNVEVFRRTVNEVVHLVCMHLKNSRKYKLEVQFDFRRQQKLGEEESPQLLATDLELLRKLVFDEHPNRFERMHLLAPPYTWNNIGNDTSNLHSVSLAYVYSGADLQQLPRLTHVSLYSATRCELPWKQLTTLEMGGIVYDHCVWVLTECTSLRSVKMVEAQTPELEYEIANVFTLEHLEHFEWSFPRETYVYYNSCVLNNSRLPVVKNIIFHDLFARTSSYGYYLRDFYSKIPASLSSMTFDLCHVLQFYDEYIDSWREELWSYFEITPQSITHLRFEGICLDFLADFFKYMLWRLPKLSHLEIVKAPEAEHSCSFPHFHGAVRASKGYRNYLIEMTEVSSALEDGFHLGIHGYGSGDNWKTSFEKITEQFRQKGFNICFEHTT